MTARPPAERTAGLRLGFVRGTSPNRWAERWQRITGTPLELVPVDWTFGHPELAAARMDVLLERARPGQRPADISSDTAHAPPAARHAVHLYTEALALVVHADHELAGSGPVPIEDLQLIPLLAHPDHDEAWPAATPWEDPAWVPPHARAAMDLVATGAGAMLLPLPLARQLSSRQHHAVLPVQDGPPAGEIWATWAVERDDADVQDLIGVLRGRTARSSRGTDRSAPPAEVRAAPRKRRTSRRRSGPPHSRS